MSNSAILQHPPLEKVVRTLRQELPRLQAKHGVAALSVFGSCARGAVEPGSDLDLLVEFTRAPGFFEFVALEDELSAMLGVKVDLVMKSALRPAIGRRVLREALAV